MGANGPRGVHEVGEREPVLMPLRPGEVYWADFPDVGRRPVAILSREELNRGKYVVAVQFTSAKIEVRRELPNCVAFRAGTFGLAKDCVAQAETIAVFDLANLDLKAGPIGVLDSHARRDLTRAVGYMMDAECEPA
jgi:mRNA-degrading endonuclease toxin of MazEF toxin-antitoxin module